jgi:hypothetical protein
MKWIILFFIFTNSAFAGNLLGGRSFSSCITSNEMFDVLYFISFNQKGVGFEIETFSAKGSKPCDGRMVFIIGRLWDYKVNGNELSTILKLVHVTLHDQKASKIFNELKICNVDNWQVKVLQNCLGEKAIFQEERPGFKTHREFILKNDKLILMEGEEVFMEYTEE